MQTAHLVCLLLGAVAASAGEALPKPERIVNGVECDAEKFPYTVSIRVRRRTVHNCGGSLLNGFNVLTAAHCYTEGRQYLVVAGQTHLLKWPEYVQVQEVARVYVHPQYNESNRLKNDIAIFRLQGSIWETAYTKYVRLPAPGSFPPCPVLELGGWGLLADRKLKKMRTMNLRCVSLHVVDDTECRNYTGRDTVLCTYEKVTPRSPCQGDSGSPLVCADVQYGIVSSAIDCKGYLPAKHTKVSAFDSFIRKCLVSQAVHVNPSYFYIFICILFLYSI